MASQEDNIVDKHGKTLFIRNLPYSTTNNELETIFSDIGPLKSCFVVSDKDTGKCRGFGYVKYTLFEDAQKALKTVKKVGGRNIQMMIAKRKEKKKFGAPKAKEVSEAKEEEEEDDKAETNVSVTTNTTALEKKRKKGKKSKAVPEKGVKQADNPYNEGKRARLIVRNLSFKCNEEQLKKAFAQYGNIVDVKIPTKGNGRKLGFGFVQFSTKAEAGMAVKGGNGKSILDRKVAVDFTLPKEKFEQRAAESKSQSVVQEDDSEEEDMEVDQPFDEQKKKEDETNEGQDETSAGEKEKDTKRKKFKDPVDSDDDDDEEEEEEDSDESEDEDEEEDDSESDSGIDNKQSKPKKESDVNEGRTVFIRNLPFNISEEELEDHISTYGDVIYARNVVDRETGMSRGTAFVQFKSKSSAEACLKDSHELGGRELSITMAVTREKAVQLVGKKDEPKEKKDTRNLYLVREGMIRPGTEQAKDVPQADLIRRQKIDAQKRKKLKDQDVFVSSTRLCIHNIPSSVTDKQLRTIVLKAADDKKAKLIETRIMRDMDRVNTDGVAKSRGYAFCAFSQHEHALAALRELNNNPKIFGPQKRPIVEFSLESRKALEVKQKRIEKSQFRQKQKSFQKSQNSKPENKDKKKKQNFKQKHNARPVELKKQQDKVARSLHKGALGLPSHSGPKQRHKPRNTESNIKMKKKPSKPLKRHQEQKQRESQKIPKELKQKSRRQKPDSDSFDKLVASYKKRIMSSGTFS